MKIMTVSRREVALLAVCLGAIFAAACGSAWAGSYTVLSCRDRAGDPLSVSDASGGWVTGGTGGPGLDALDRCSDSAHEFLATVSGIWTHPVGSMAWWRFVPPSGTLIEGADILYSGNTRPYDGQNRGIVYLSGAQAGLPGHETSARDPSRRGGRLGAACTTLGYRQPRSATEPPVAPTAPPGSVHATVEILRSEILLTDISPPNAGAASGSAVTSPTWQDTMTFAFPATDEGGGVYQAVLEVDGEPACWRETINDWGGRCVDTTPGQRVFRYPQPCLTSVDAIVPVDASALPAGDHDVALRVSDAAGNVRTVYAARKTIVAPGRTIGPGSALAERGAANGDNAADAVRLTAR